MIWCGECGYKGKGLYLENEVYCPYCKATGNDIVALPIDNNTRNLTDEETDIYNNRLEAEAETIDETHCYKEVMKMNEHIEKETLIKAIQEDYNIRMQEMYKEEIFQGYYSKVYCDGVDDEFKSVIKIIENMPYSVKGEICTTLEDGDTNG